MSVASARIGQRPLRFRAHWEGRGGREQVGDAGEKGSIPRLRNTLLVKVTQLEAAEQGFKPRSDWLSRLLCLWLCAVKTGFLGFKSRFVYKNCLCVEKGRFWRGFPHVNISHPTYRRTQPKFYSVNPENLIMTFFKALYIVLAFILEIDAMRHSWRFIFNSSHMCLLLLPRDPRFTLQNTCKESQCTK